MTKEEENMIILNRLYLTLFRYPSLRFGQALLALNIVKQKDIDSWEDEFYTESAEILNRMQWD